jgi:hypothetical protein
VKELPIPMNELPIPMDGDQFNPVEMARVWITADEGLSYISLNFGMFEDQELDVWGSLAADLIAHAVRAYKLEGGSMSADEAFAVVEAALRSRIADNPTQKGHFGGRVLS